MATAIHHGGGVGTYKTFSVIQRHAIPQLLNGRLVISTIRGFDSLRVIEAVMDLEFPESAEIIFIDLETTKGIEKIRRFWEWVPIGAYIIIDEAQLIYPKSKRITTYDYPSSKGLTSSESAERDNKPNGFLQAFTMQRHYQWDLAIITPNIKMLVPEIKEVAQTAYEHKYMGGLLPWAKHGWREIQHSPLEAGKNSKHPPVRYTADQRIYKVYKSTKTGTHSTGNAELSIFKNPKIVQALFIAIFSIALFLYAVGSVLTSEKKLPVSIPNGLPTVEIPDTTIHYNGDSGNGVSSVGAVLDGQLKPVETTFLDVGYASIVGKFFSYYIIEFGLAPNEYQVTTAYLFDNGINLNIISDCLIEMTYNEIVYNIRCPLHKRKVEAVKKHAPIEFGNIATFTGT